ncbi:MAG: preprotein translocase subunit SecE [Clostridia bacterium]|nr:preprotein translocase subunit SecE [Clostridia bacterium]
MLVISCSSPAEFVDIRPLDSLYSWGSIEYGFAVWGVTIALLASAVLGVAHLLLDDYIIVNSSKSAKYTIPKRLVRFFKDYKSEVNKIVWPTRKTVFKNTLIVLVICLILGAFIWLVDFGLGTLLDLIF